MDRATAWLSHQPDRPGVPCALRALDSRGVRRASRGCRRAGHRPGRELPNRDPLSPAPGTPLALAAGAGCCTKSSSTRPSLLVHGAGRPVLRLCYASVVVTFDPERWTTTPLATGGS